MPEPKNTRSRGLLVSATRTIDNLIRISLDDVVQIETEDTTWTFDCHYTSKSYPEKDFDDLDFDEKELAAFGYHILARLYAFKKRGEL